MSPHSILLAPSMAAAELFSVRALFSVLLICVLLFIESTLVESELYDDVVASNLSELVSTTALKTRKSVRGLSYADKADLVRRFKALQSSPDPSGQYSNWYSWFVYTHEANMNSAHDGPAFLPWHRQFVLKFEAAMQAMDTSQTFALPYWDWENDVPGSTKNYYNNEIWTDSVMGGDGPAYPGYPGEVLSGPFVPGNWTVVNVQFFPGKQLVRQFGATQTDPPRQDGFLNVNWLLGTSRKYDVSPYGGLVPGVDPTDPNKMGWRSLLEYGVHAIAHNFVGGQMTIVPIAVNDPVFMLHHCSIDRLWAIWQRYNPIELQNSSTTYPSSGARKGHNLNDYMRPWDFPPVTPASVINYPSMGYQYSIPYLFNTPSVFPDTTSNTPALAYFQNSIFMAYAAASGSGVCIVSGDGIRWGSCTWIWTSVSWSGAPALEQFNGALVLAIADTSHSGICIGSSSTPAAASSWGVSCTWIHTNDGTNQPPSLTTYGSQLYMAYGAKGQGNGFCITSTSGDIVNGWTGCNWIYNSVTTASPSIYGTSVVLYLSWNAPDGSVMWASSKTPNSRWTSATTALPSGTTSDSISVVSHENDMYLAYEDANLGLHLAAKDNLGNFITFTPPLPSYQAYYAPSLVSNGNILCMAWRGASDNRVYVASSWLQ